MVDRAPPFPKAHAYALRCRAQSGRPDERPFLGHLVDELAHVVHELVAGHLTGVLVDSDHGQESHGVLSSSGWIVSLIQTSNEASGYRHAEHRT
jgi:hypothetical protein